MYQWILTRFFRIFFHWYAGAFRRLLVSLLLWHVHLCHPMRL